MKKIQLVTRESLDNLLSRQDDVGNYAIGRALVTLFNRQTNSEKTSNTTTEHNLVGFTQADARSGCISAKYFLKHGKLEPFHRTMWLKRNKNGGARLAKYWEQLNEEAMEKRYAKLKQQYIDACDTGILGMAGGIVSEMRQIEKQMKKEAYIYCGDTAALESSQH